MLLTDVLRINCQLTQAKQTNFLKQTNWNNVPLKLPDLTLKFNNITLKGVIELKFLGVTIDRNSDLAKSY